MLAIWDIILVYSKILDDPTVFFDKKFANKSKFAN